ncbi:MAG: PAS domain-containing sensor histidine kinase [Myxococcales bacterium]|nr:PAS domain-containing sensor histidine kinase [Myxococcota bacterium]MDW8283645.1 PAS domain-containing sensor histidine kinase [Myxococcales bacterium]
MAGEPPLQGDLTLSAQILEAIGALVVVLDPQGHVVYFNRACQESTGYSLEELAGRPFWDVLLPPEEAAAMQATFHDPSAVQVPSRFESFWVGKEGRQRLITWSNTPLFDATGRVRYIVGTGLDVTERRQMEEALRRSEQQHADLLHSLNAICWEADPETLAFRFVTQEAERLLGYPLARWIDDPTFWTHHLVHPEDRAWVVPFCMAETRAGRSHDFEYRVLAADGRTLWLRDIVRVEQENGRTVGLKGVMVDITSRKLAELERDQLLQRLQEAILARDEFLSIASHELRSPLTSMQLALQHLLRIARNRPLSEASAQVMQALEVAERQCRQLGKLVNALLDISRIRAGRLHLDLRQTDLVAVVQEAVLQLRGELEASGSSLDIEASGPLWGQWDPGRILQVVTNLLSNAIKYGGGRPISIRILQGDSHARLTVADQGIGIPADRIGTIFDRFTRAVSPRHYGGLGLGLYIVRSLVEAHGGRVTVQSEVGVGSTFGVELPLSAPPSAQTMR